MVTSQKSHGKWGDFIVCLVPISWCVNILSNSNFILRMLEWQTESSLFTIRVRGRQWYWVYKIELKGLLNATHSLKNIGQNHWISTTNQSTGALQNKINLIILKNHNKEYLNIYKKNLKALVKKNLGYQIMYPVVSNAKHGELLNNLRLVYKNHINENKRGARSVTFGRPKHVTSFIGLGEQFYLNWREITSTIITKNTPDNLYFVLKQKRFAPVIKKLSSIQLDLFKGQLFLRNGSSLFFKNQFDYTTKWVAKRLKYKASDISNVYNKRLLRTKRVLVLPTNVNITVITNSFDVVHSWYIPGLGLKLDCIPGRSTHHTLNIDQAGFYYGQCAEICGRFHHHMPIRICALPFEHFLIWWYHYGLPYFNATAQNRKLTIKNGIRQFSW